METSTASPDPVNNLGRKHMGHGGVFGAQRCGGGGTGRGKGVRGGVLGSVGNGGYVWGTEWEGVRGMGGVRSAWGAMGVYVKVMGGYMGEGQGVGGRGTHRGVHVGHMGRGGHGGVQGMGAPGSVGGCAGHGVVWGAWGTQGVWRHRGVRGTWGYMCGTQGCVGGT